MDTPVFKSHYPTWPWVDLGTHSSNSACNLKLPPPEGNVKLMEQISVGRMLSRLVEGNEDQAYNILKDYYKLDPNAPLKGQRTDEPTMLNEAWTVTNTSLGLDNRGVVRLKGKKTSPYSENMSTNQLADRSLDYIMSVLESLPVGNFDGKSRFQGEPVVLWDENRTASSVTYPYGPNIRIRFEQNKPYDPYRGNGPSALPATNYTFENIFNIYDGVIIMIKHNPNSPPAMADGKDAPPPACADWSDATFQQWIAMHAKDKKHGNGPLGHLDAEFPPTKPIGNDPLLFGERLVAGRMPSKLRKPLSYYVRLSGEEMIYMRQNLNYIVMCGEAIWDGALPVILRCLQSRNKDSPGRGPVWGAHELFEIGSWQFNALLGEVGYDVAMFLGRHKAFSGGLGPKMIKSATVFAVDCVKLITNPTTGAQERALMKWPAIIWEICPVHADLVARACVYEQKYVEFYNFTSHKKDIYGNPILPNDRPGTRLAQDIIMNCNDSKFAPRVYLPLKELMLNKMNPGNMVVAVDQRE